MEIPKKSPKAHFCDCCDYTTANSKDFKKHLTTRKHILMTNPTKILQKIPKIPQKSPPTNAESFECNCGKVYKHRTTLARKL